MNTVIRALGSGARIAFYLLLSGLGRQCLAAGPPSASLGLTAIPNPSFYGQSVTFAAVVTPASATGWVTFYEGTSIVGSAPVNNGLAMLTTAMLQPGTRQMRAFYGGDASNGSASVLTSHVVHTAPVVGLSSPVGFSVIGSEPISLAAADMDRDGNIDLISTDYFKLSLSILLGKGDGTFRSPLGYPISSLVFAIAVADFNRDGNPDVVTVNRTLRSISIFLGNGNGFLQSPVSYTVGTSPNHVAIGDLDSDGIADMVVCNSDSEDVSILLGRGDGTFSDLSTIPLTKSPRFTAIGDFNVDGKPDLAIATANSHDVSILFGNGNATFRAPVRYPVATSALQVIAEDFNGDGKTDLAISDYATQEVVILSGDGNGSFQTSGKYFVPALSFIDVNDFNGDGILDLVSRNGYAAVAILLGKGDGSFATPVPFGIPAPGTLVTADFNGDSRPDLAVADLTKGIAVLTGLGPLTASPQTGAGSSQTFSAGFAPPDGVSPIAWVQMLFAVDETATDGKHCLIHYDRKANGLWLFGDQGFFLGPVAPGAASSLLHNSSCSISTANSMASFLGNNVALRVSVVFHGALSGQRNLFLRSHDASGQDSGFQTRGTWTASADAGSPMSITPNAGGGFMQSFSAVFSDPPLFPNQHAEWMQILFATAPDGGGRPFCQIHYDRRGNALWLFGDEGYFMGPITPGSGNFALQNSTCKITAAGTIISTGGPSLHWTMAITFRSGLQGTRNIYLRSLDVLGRDSGFQLAGTWLPNAPTGLQAVPYSGYGLSGLFAGEYADFRGNDHLKFVQFLIANDAAGSTGDFCLVHYDRPANQLWLYGRSGFFLGPVTPGTASNVLQNQLCTVDAANSFVSETSTLALFLPLNLRANGVQMTKKIFLRAMSVDDLDSGFQERGSWTVPGVGN